MLKAVLSNNLVELIFSTWDASMRRRNSCTTVFGTDREPDRRTDAIDERRDGSMLQVGAKDGSWAEPTRCPGRL